MTIRGSSEHFGRAKGGFGPAAWRATSRSKWPGPEVADGISDAYHAKYDRYGPTIVGTVVSPESARSTLRLVPR